VTEQQFRTLSDATIIETELGQRMTVAEAKQKQGARKLRIAQTRKSGITRNPNAPVVSNPRTLSAPSPSPAALAPGAVGGRVTPPLPAGLGGALGGGPVQFSGCGATATTQRYFSAVNGASSGVSFTPGGAYKFSGCGFGTAKGTIQLTGGSGGGWQSVSLVVQSWSNDTIVAKVDPNLSGVTDQANVIVVITDAKNGVLQQGGHSFTAAQVVTPLTSLPASFVVSGLKSQASVQAPGAAGATFSVSSYFDPGTQYCPHDFPEDTFLLSKVVLRPGFTIDHVDAVNRDVAQPDDGSYEYRLLNGFSSAWKGDDFTVAPQVLQVYEKRDIFLGGSSMCGATYDVTVYVRGPKGMPAL
jgi:hypothetical protein